MKLQLKFRLSYLVTIMLISGCFLLLSHAQCLAKDQLGLKVGDMAPDFEALHFGGSEIQFSNYYAGGGEVVLIFYRGGWCPYCNKQLKDFLDHFEDFEELDVPVVALSVDNVANAEETSETYENLLEIISDPSTEALRQYNLVYQVPEDLNKKYKEEYNIDLEAASGRDDGVIAVPATFVVDGQGKVIFAEVHEDYKVRTKAETVIEFIQEHQSKNKK